MIKNDTLPQIYRPQERLTLKGRERAHLQNNIKAKPKQQSLARLIRQCDHK
jgi:hypothetical protein